MRSIQAPPLEPYRRLRRLRERGRAAAMTTIEHAGDARLTVTVRPRALRRTEKLANRAEAWMRLGRLRTIRRMPLGAEGHCYDNVQRQCIRAGGSVALGWWLCHEPGIFLGAFHHAVWRAPSGELLDLETPEADDESSYVTFLPDPTPLGLLSPEPFDDRQTLLARPRKAKIMALGIGARPTEIVVRFREQIDEEAGQLVVKVYRPCHDDMLGKGAWLRAIVSPSACSS
jgi:hypothetical protein